MDVNRLGQSQATAFGHDIGVYRKRFEAFGWRVEDIDGHDIEEILEVLGGVGLDDQPLVIIAKTYKGAGVSFLQDKDGWHGKPLNKEEAARAIAELQPSAKSGVGVPIPAPNQLPAPNNAAPASYPPISYKLGDLVATREAYGNALARIGEVDPRIVAMDGDTKNSTYSEKFFKKFPDRFTECFIAEQNMVGVATGFGTRGKVPFASTFALFLHPRLRPDPRGGHFAGEPQARRLARRRQHRRGRPVADGSGRPRHDARDCRQHGAVSERRGQRGETGRTNGAGQRHLFPAHVAPQDAGDLQQRRSISRSAAPRCCARARATRSPSWPPA